MKFRDYLIEIDAPGDFSAWVGDRSIRQAWAESDRADRMLWLLMMMAGKPGWPELKTVVGLVCDCIEPALEYVPEEEKRPKRAIDTIRAWIRGESTIEDLQKARRIAWAAARASYAAAYAVADAALATADAAASAITYASTAIVCAAGDKTWAEALSDMADMLRTKVPAETLPARIKKEWVG